MVIRFGVLASCVLFVGCDAKSTTSPSTASATTTSAASAASPPGLAGLEATLNGERLVLQTAVAFSRGGRSLEIVFSTAQPGCKDFEGNGRMLADGEEHFSVTVVPLLGADGKESWGIARRYYDGHTQQGGDLGKLTITSARPEEGVEGELSFAVALKANEHMKTPARELKVEGPFTAKGCGTFKKKDWPAARPQDDLKLTVAGKAFAIQSALVEPTTFPEPGHELVLSTTPASCDKSTSDTDLTLKLNVADDGRVQYVFMAGNVLSSQLNGSPPKDGPTLVAEAPEGFGGEGEVRVALKGELDVVGYPVVTSGEVIAQRCAADE